MSHESNWRLHLMLGVGKLHTVDDSGGVQTGQVQFSAAEASDGTPVMTHFGFSSNAPAGTDVVYASFAGNRSKSVVIASNYGGNRPTGLPAGGTQIYDLGGRKVSMPNDGTIILLAPGETLRQLVTEAFMAVFNEHTHGGGPAPNQQMTSAHLTGSTRAGGP